MSLLGAREAQMPHRIRSQVSRNEVMAYCEGCSFKFYTVDSIKVNASRSKARAHAIQTGHTVVMDTQRTLILKTDR